MFNNKTVHLTNENKIKKMNKAQEIKKKRKT